MKRLLKTICLTLAVILVTASVGCSTITSGKQVDLTNAPDYSQSTEQFQIFAYNAVCDDWYQRNGVRFTLGESLATRENMQKYVDGGFNYLFVDWVFQDHTTADGYNFETGKLKPVLDLANEFGLKCVVYQPEIQGLSNLEESRINPDKAPMKNNQRFFNSQEELNKYVADALAPIKDHPAFDGVVLIDEPGYKKFDAIGEVYQAVVAADPDCFVMLNLLPFADSTQHKTLYCGTTTYTAEEAYQMYLNTYYEKVGKYLGYVQYDDYPILKDGVLASFLYCNQVISNFCAEKGLKRITLYQSYTYSNRRATNEADIYFQMNVGQAFGNKSFCWYTYYPLINTNTDYIDETDAIVNYSGNPNPRYYSTQKVHQEMQFNAKALMHFEYKAMQYQIKTPVNSIGYIAGLVNDEFTLLKGYSFDMKVQEGGIVLVTELYDKDNDRYGYYVVNITDPQFTSEAIVELDFGSYQYAQIHQFGEASNVVANGGKVSVSLGSGRGAFVIPF